MIDEAILTAIHARLAAALATPSMHYRPLVVECFNPGFLAAMGVRGALYHSLFLGLAVLNMVAAFQALGTLMALGLMLLPAVAASFSPRANSEREQFISRAT